MDSEEDFNATTCDGEGQFTIASLNGSYDGEGCRSTPRLGLPAPAQLVPRDGAAPSGARHRRSLTRGSMPPRC